MEFTVPSWLVSATAVAASVLIAFGVFHFWRRLEQSRIPWRPLAVPNVQGVHWYGPESVKEAHLAAAFTAAVDALARKTTWGRRVYRALAKTHILVMLYDTWVDGSGRKVAGLDPPGPVVQVGHNLAALAHELAHQCEDAVDGAVDYEHAAWGAKGVWNAINEYQTWLASQTATRG